MKQILINNYMLNWRLSEKQIYGLRLEGNISISPIFINDIVKYASANNILNVLDLGFNAGHTAVALLTANKKINVVSFDMGYNNYISIAKKFIDTTFNKRHKLIVGDSKKTLLSYHKTHPQMKFDIIIIDSDHNNIIRDIINCKTMAHKNTIIIIADTIILKKKQIITEKNIKPTRAFQKLIDIKQLSFSEYHRYNDITGITISKFIM